jgi:hypothetical protein
MGHWLVGRNPPFLGFEFLPSLGVGFFVSSHLKRDENETIPLSVSRNSHETKCETIQARAVTMVGRGLVVMVYNSLPPSTITTRLSRYPIAPLRRRSCDASGQPASSSHASQNAGAVERENGTAVDRSPPVGRRSSPQRWHNADCHRSMPSHQSAHLALPSRARYRETRSPVRPPIRRTSCHAYRLPGKGNSPARVAAHRFRAEKAPQDSRVECSRRQRLQRRHDHCQVTIV